MEALANFNFGYLVITLILFFMLTGMPIAFALGATAMIAILLDPSVVPTIVGVIPFGGANNYLLVAAVLFMVTGELMNYGDIARRLIDFASSLVGHIRGGLAHVNIITSLFFAGISGTATADAAAIGSVMIPQMSKRGFPVNFSAAVTATSATLSIIVPPSLNLILYAYVAEASIAQLFIAGIMPGILVCAALLGMTYGIAVREGFPIEHQFQWQRVRKTGQQALLPLVIPVIVLGGLLGGIFTATEAGAISALAALIIAGGIYRNVRWSQLVDVLRISGQRTAMLMFIVATSSLLGWYLTRQRIPQQIAEGILNVSDNYWVVLFLINLFFLLAGTIIHGTPAILLLVPIFMPLVREFGVDPVHFGLIVTLNLGIGQQTPPVASVVLITCAVAKIPMRDILRPLSYFLVSMVACLVLVNVFPQISLWLPSVLLPGRA
ncbi:MAG: TRAP transporter large permease [Synechococcaceae cyanobacterium SM2_3_60]|nr:TRAP transporter large permease [Synechococcaceae cyanobacterium SM2_3_60]